MKKQQGFSLTIVLIALLVAIVGASVVYVQSQNKDTDTKPEVTSAANTSNEANDQASSEVNMAKTEENTAKPEPIDDAHYVAIPDWGVKLKVGAYKDKVTISNPKHEAIRVSVKPEFDEYADCTSEVSITRIKDVSDFDTPPKMKLDDYYYYNSGVSECGGAKPSTNKNLVTLSELTAYFKDIVVVSQ